MRRIENHCNCCDLPCINCGRQHVEVIYCDDCKDSDCEKMYSYDDKELCYDCAKDTIIRDYICSEKPEKQVTIINQIVGDNFITKIGDNRYIVDKDYDYEYSLVDVLIETMDYIMEFDLETLINRLEVDCFAI